MSTPATLTDLAGRINAEHAACMATARDAVARAIEVGRLLAEAKGRVRHGEWGAWVAEHCAFGIREAQRYMQVFRNAGQLDPDTSRVSHLTGLRGALVALSSPTDAASEADEWPGGDWIPVRDMPEASRHRLCDYWWDQRARYTVMLDAAGWDALEIADFLGRPTEDIEAILDPRPPARFDSEANGLFMFADGARPDQIQRMTGYYADNVAYQIDRWLENACRMARCTCEADGFGDAEPILRAWERRHRNRHEAAERRGIWPSLPFAGDPRADGTFWSCTVFDARHAVRINVEGDKDNWAPTLMKMWLHQLEALEGADEEIARKQLTVAQGGS